MHTSSVPSTKETPGVGADRSNPVPLNTDTPLDAEWSLKVTSVNFDATAEIVAANQFNKPPSDGKKYVLVNFEAKYTGTKKTAPYALTLRVVGKATNVSITGSENFVVSPHFLDVTQDVCSGAALVADKEFTVAVADLDSLCCTQAPAVRPTFSSPFANASVLHC